MMVTLGEGLAQAADNGIIGHQGTSLEQRTKQYHIICLGIAHFDGCIGGIYRNDADIGACGCAVYAVGVVDERSAGLNLALEFIKGLLVENYGSVVAVNDGRGYGAVTDDDGDIGCAAALLGAVSWHPSGFEVVHECGIGQYFAHRQDALAAESGYNDFFFHCLRNLMWVGWECVSTGVVSGIIRF